MTTIIIIITVFVLFSGLLIYLDKTKIVEDKNENLIPDAIEEKVEEVKELVKEVVKQSKDVVGVAKANARKGRKPSQTKNTNTKK